MDALEFVESDSAVSTEWIVLSRLQIAPQPAWR